MSELYMTVRQGNQYRVFPVGADASGIRIGVTGVYASRMSLARERAERLAKQASAISKVRHEVVPIDDGFAVVTVE